MNQKTLIGLVVAALAAIVIAIVLNHSSQPRSEGGSEEAANLVPALRDHVNDVNKVIVTGAENKTIATITRNGDGWTLGERGGYAADTGKLRALLLKLADAKLVEQKTASKDKYATLGVEDTAGKDAKGIEIELDGLAQPVKLIIGTANPRGGTFVRRDGDAQSWLASGALTVDKKPEDWLRKDLADVPAARVASVSIVRPDGKNVRVAKTAEGDASFRLAEVPKGREPGSDFTLNGLAANLAALRFDDVVAAKDATPGDAPLKVRYALFDGIVIDGVAWEKDGKDYVQFNASLDSGQANQHIAAQQAKAKTDTDAGTDATTPDMKANADATPKPEAVADPAKDREQKLAALNKEVADLNARFGGWTYVLPPYKYANINKSPDELLKPLEEKKTDAAKTAKPPVKPGAKTQ